MLVTGQADQSDTIRAVNQAGLDYYIGKRGTPMSCEPPCATSSPSTSSSPTWTRCYVSVLDGVRVMEAIR